ncbi:MAG: protein translocase subunit SecF [Acutalibacter sp.]
MNEKTYRFHFYQNKKIYFGISIVLLVVGILASVIIGPHLDIQFAGGSMILYSVEGGQADASGVEAAVSESTGRNCEVAISQDITTGGEQVTVSFSGNQAMTPEEQATVTSALQSAYPDLGFELLSSSSVEASMGARFFQKCLVCFAITAVFLLVYIALRFRKIGGLAAGITAVIALMHDVLIAFCVFVVCGLDIDDIFIAVILTILGYSLNATIVVYDRVRENRRKMGPRVSYDEVMNLSMNQTLGRTVLTSLCTFLSLVVVLIVAMIYNIDTVVSFALPMMAGVAAGCFSSQFIAPNLFCMWQIHKRKQMDAAKQKA